MGSIYHMPLHIEEAVSHEVATAARLLKRYRGDGVTYRWIRPHRAMRATSTFPFRTGGRGDACDSLAATKIYLSHTTVACWCWWCKYYYPYEYARCVAILDQVPWYLCRTLQQQAHPPTTLAPRPVTSWTSLLR